MFRSTTTPEIGKPLPSALPIRTMSGMNPSGEKKNTPPVR